MKVLVSSRPVVARFDLCIKEGPGAVFIAILLGPALDSSFYEFLPYIDTSEC